MKDTIIAVLGGGNLGTAIAHGLHGTGDYKPENIIITRRKRHDVEALTKKGMRVFTNNQEAVIAADIVILCVQPRQLNALLHDVKGVLSAERHLLVSTITGVSITEIEQIVGKDFPIVRAMPNTAIAIRESMTCIATRNASEEQLKRVENIFNVMGRTLRIEEELVAAATVLGASGIAFCLRYIRALAQGGIQMGFHAEEAQAIAIQTCRGAASLILEAGSHPEMEIDRVTTPQGCTIAGLNEMEHNGLSSAVIKGIVASYERIANIQK